MQSPTKSNVLQQKHTHPFNGQFSGTTQVSRYQKGKNNLDFTEARDSEWQWHQLGHMQVCISPRQITTPASHHSVFTGWMPFLLPKLHQSTEGIALKAYGSRATTENKHKKTKARFSHLLRHPAWKRSESIHSQKKR